MYCIYIFNVLIYIFVANKYFILLENRGLQRGTNMRITQEKMDAIAVLMDDETREKVHHELAPCEPIEFLKRYCELEPSFEPVLKDEFAIEI